MKSITDAAYLVLEMAAFFAVLVLLHQAGIIHW